MVLENRSLSSLLSDGSIPEKLFFLVGMFLYRVLYIDFIDFKTQIILTVCTLYTITNRTGKGNTALLPASAVFAALTTG